MSMTEEEILAEFRAAEALLEGHSSSPRGCAARSICNARAC